MRVCDKYVINYMVKRVILLSLSVSMAVAGHAQRMMCDEACRTEFVLPADEMNRQRTAVTGGVNYAVVSPVGRSTVAMIDMAPRLSTLDGKTIAVVGGSFMASVTHPEIKRLILENYPTAKVLLLDEIGAAGVYPAPGITRRGKDEFQSRLRELGVDAVIAESTVPPVWYDTDAETMMTIPTMKAGMTVLLVTGDYSRNKVQTMPGGGYATVRIELPNEWDRLTRELGYNPIEEYYIK